MHIGEWIVGIDVGGTFTDIIAVNQITNQRRVAKLPSTPERPAAAMIAGMAQICADIGIDATDVARLAHGTTVATNALIQHRGAKLALITTAGFRDVLEIGRQVRPHMFDLHRDPPPALVPRERRFEVRERITADGSVREALDDAEIARVVAEVEASGAQACAVCLLFSFRRPEHERRLRDALRAAMPDLPVSISSEVHPEFREFERFSTTVINAFVQPVMAAYLGELAAGMAEKAPAMQIGINQSSGGLMSVERAVALPVRTALSGPAAGIVGAVRSMRASGDGNFITLDMGGTSADICLIRDFEPEATGNREVEGYPVRLPALDISAVGAGGGSIAWLDRDGLLKVGPQSAGAVPGPACYGRGGVLPTVSDANLYLGRLSPDGLLGGRMRMDVDAAETALRGPAEALGLDVMAVALGIVRIVNSNMVRAIRRVSIERGHDPRDFTLVPFGGAGALHAMEVARALGIRRVNVPELPGLLCAQGLIGAEQRESFVRSVLMPLTNASLDQLAEHIAALRNEAQAWFDAEAIGEPHRELRLALDMRYVGQNFELSVPVAGWPAAMPDAETLRAAFLVAHERNYGFNSGAAPIEIVNVRLDSFGRHPVGEQKASPVMPAQASRLERSKRDVTFEQTGTVPATVVWRGSLQPGDRIDGPAVIEQLDATIVLHPGDSGVVDQAGNLILEVGA
ncbi:hydantoinase/oxoprolinase family protein [Paraburkholderia acidisoli]|uniref:Hydantoinase/oxoprolinase family protein n=1 Tax=Paraburkholderia acidisoli TaxID=2571748 RepID=A0A7Z2GQK6_9BURK|nr:hydantoinase/oxoprolinase family protein [Paraburkholderia acidisoli]QGZ66093.1 hydantoinase/oxoprolinase family protein [Paraburkholderia acidisoli]